MILMHLYDIKGSNNWTEMANSVSHFVKVACDWHKAKLRDFHYPFHDYSCPGIIITEFNSLQSAQSKMAN